MVKNSRMIIVFILVLFLGAFVFNQEKKVNENKQLREEILSAYRSGGKKGLRRFLKKKMDKISDKFIVDFARDGMKGEKKEWLKACKIMAEKKKDKKTLANVLYYLGRFFILNKNNKKSTGYFDKALAIYLKLNDHFGQGKIYYCKGKIYSKNGEDSRALEMYDTALPCFEKAGRLVSQGNVYQSKGDIYLKIVDNYKALEMYNKALTIFEKMGKPVGQGNVYLSKGEIYSRIGDNPGALEMYEKARHFFEKAGQQVGQGNVYFSKGDIYSVMGENKKALGMYDKALPFFKKAGQQVGQGNVYLGKGEIYSVMGDNSRALEMFKKALTFFEKAGQPAGQGNVYLSKGKIYIKKSENKRALKMFDKALDFYEKAGDIMSESNALCCKAKVRIKQGKKDEARILFKEAIDKLEKVRTQTAFLEMKKTFMEMACKRYAEVALFMLENKYYYKGFKYAESMKARCLFDKMVEGFTKLDRGITTEQKEKRKRYVAQLSSFSKEMHKNAGKNEKKYQELKEKHRKVKKDFEELLVEIRQNNPIYKRVNYKQPITVPELQKKVLKEKELLLRYFISPNKLYVLIISRESFKVVPIIVKEEKIKQMVKRYLSAVGENNSIHIKRCGETLYKELFKPLEADIKKDKDIIIIPDGELAKIPFESLIIDRDKSGRPVYLLEKYKVNYLQSASILSELRENFLDRGTKSFIGFGDPVYDYENFKQDKPEHGTLARSPGKGDEIRGIYRSRYARAGGILPRLKGSGKEVEAIANLFKKKSQKSIFHERDQSTEENAKAADMKDFDFIHFACHGLLNDDFQCLVLSQDIPGAKEDGYFTLNEIMNCKYEAKVVVFSACQTGRGKIVKGEGITGFTTAVLGTGAQAVVATLWDAEDTATKELMVNFYKNMLEENMDKTEALRQAKLELIKSEKYHSPRFWSSFVMYGE